MSTRDDIVQRETSSEWLRKKGVEEAGGALPSWGSHLPTETRLMDGGERRERGYGPGAPIAGPGAPIADALRAGIIAGYKPAIKIF